MICFKKITAIFLVLVILLSSFAACKNGGDQNLDSGSTSEQVTPQQTDPIENSTDAPSVDDPSDETVNLVSENGSLNYGVVRPSKSVDGDVDYNSALYARERLMEVMDAPKVKIKDDFILGGKEHDSEAYEILIGNTNYKETAASVGDCKYGDYVIKVVGNKIIIFAYMEGALTTAIDQFLELIEKNKVETETGYSVELTHSQINVCETVYEYVSDIPMFDGGKFKTYYDAGYCSFSEATRCDEIIINNVTETLYDAYLSKLDENGYEKYKENEFADNQFAIYESETQTLTVGYYAYNDTVRILAENEIPRLPEKESYDKITTSQITMLGTEYLKSDGTKSGNGLSLIIRLEDGRFIVVDGATANSKQVDTFIKTIKSQSAAYTDTPVIAAWIITHTHGDHQGVLANRHEKVKEQNIKVQNVISNAMSDVERRKSHEANPDTFSKNEGDPKKIYAAAEALNATMHRAHVGYEYYFADAKIEVLYTLESLAPLVIRAFNSSSMVLRFTFTNDGKETTFMVPADATGEAMRVCVNMYGDFLKSDIVQVNHHGYSTWGDNEGVIMAYQKINATLVLWPQGLTDFQSYRYKKQNAPLFGLPNFKECWVSGAEGDVTVVTLPYVYGETVVECSCTAGCEFPHKYTE